MLFAIFLQVCRHLAKLFDNVANLKFTETEDGQPTKEAIGMYSKESEYVAFNQPCDCSGQVSFFTLFCKSFKSIMTYPQFLLNLLSLFQSAI